MANFTGTDITYLVRSKHDVYYWQAKIEGSVRRGSLGTKSKSVAKTRLNLYLERARAKAASAANFEGAAGECVTVGDWVLYWVEEEKSRGRTKQSTKDDYEKKAAALKSAPFWGIDPRKVSKEMVRKWWRVDYKDLAPDTVNPRLRVLKAALALASKAWGVTFPVFDALERRPRIKRLMNLPSRADLDAIVKSVREQGKFRSEEVADLIEFLAFSGLRPGEAKQVTLGDLRGEWLWVTGGKEGTKNLSDRMVPVNPALGTVLARRRLALKEAGMEMGLLFSVASPTRALRAACIRLSLPPVRVYDLRHFFATSCMEQGIDVATLADWMGHKDGGALLLKTYTHIRREHSLNQAHGLRFA